MIPPYLHHDSHAPLAGVDTFKTNRPEVSEYTDSCLQSRLEQQPQEMLGSV